MECVVREKTSVYRKHTFTLGGKLHIRETVELVASQIFRDPSMCPVMITVPTIKFLNDDLLNEPPVMGHFVPPDKTDGRLPFEWGSCIIRNYYLNIMMSKNFIQ
jgi:hypothetical protein